MTNTNLRLHQMPRNCAALEEGKRGRREDAFNLCPFTTPSYPTSRVAAPNLIYSSVPMDTPTYPIHCLTHCPTHLLVLRLCLAALPSLLNRLPTAPHHEHHGAGGHFYGLDCLVVGATGQVTPIHLKETWGGGGERADRLTSHWTYKNT